jgi:2-polyprenyl-3-methyl-5-hydroxy-6-metoxy-1,4-benzoquinol methylase
MNNCKASEEFWNALAQDDPLWAILSDPARRGGRWDLTTFFQTGEREISTLVYQLERLVGASQLQKRRALDFGCGVGRLTQALARHYSTVVGVDIASRMIEHARRLNRHGERVTYVHTTSADLSELAETDFDLIYSDLVLQHIPPIDAVAYLDECVNRLARQGLLVFQLPSHERTGAAVNVASMAAPAYLATIEILRTPLTWVPNVKQPVVVSVRNDSTEVWDQATAGIIRVGNHWLSADGEMLIQDDARSELPLRMAPGESALVTLEVIVPGLGTHVLEIDLVHEGYSWFADKGSKACRLWLSTAETAAVGPQPPLQRELWDESLLTISPGPAVASDVTFPMHAIPRAEVLAFMASRGVETLLVEHDDRAGKEWEGFRYFVRK